MINEKGETLSPIGLLIIVVFIVPWCIGICCGILTTPFICGFRVGRKIAGEIGEKQLGWED